MVCWLLSDWLLLIEPKAIKFSDEFVYVLTEAQITISPEKYQRPTNTAELGFYYSAL